MLSGTDDRGNHSYDDIHNVSVIIFHEDYNPEEFWNHDIALLRVNKNCTLFSMITSYFYRNFF